MSENTAVATTVQDSGVATIEQSGRLAIRREQAVRQVYRELQGIQWGEALSPHTRAVVAAFCHDVGANPMHHVDLLGGRVYLNANYWSDKINGQEHFIGFEQINISKDPEAREDWGVPEHATHVYVTEIRRFINAAPIEAIRRGEIQNVEPFIQTVRECNWAGGKGKVEQKKRDGSSYVRDGDPIGDAEPAKTARTRSLRRCAARAFEAIRVANKAAVERAEELLMAEWEAEISRQQMLLSEHNPRGLPAGQLVHAIARNSQGDPISIQADPAIVKQAKVRKMPPPGMSEARFAEEETRRAADELEGKLPMSEEEQYERDMAARDGIEEQSGMWDDNRA